MFKIGVMLESFRLGLGGGIQAAAQLGVDGIQFYATGGETHFSKLRGPALADVRARLGDAGIEVAAVCGDFGGHGFEIAAHNRRRIDETKRVIELARKLDCRVVTTHIGVIPGDPHHPRRSAMSAACRDIGPFAAEHGITLAIETGPEPAIVLRRFIEGLELCAGIGVNFDPANLVMVCREDIPAAVATLAPYIVHTHAKDGRNLRPVDAGVLYGVFAGDPAPDGFNVNDYIVETPLGEGDVPFSAYLAALRANGFTTGYLTIEREVGDNPRRDIAQAVEFLRHLRAGRSG
jgi:sugar phosphate isomerase/epimerase